MHLNMLCFLTHSMRLRVLSTKLGLNYIKIPSCPKDCMLYKGEENKGLEECK